MSLLALMAAVTVEYLVDRFFEIFITSTAIILLLSDVFFAVLKLIIIILAICYIINIVSWIRRKDERVLVSPFDVMDGTYGGKAISDLLIFELNRIRKKFIEQGEGRSSKKEHGQPHNSQKEDLSEKKYYQAPEKSAPAKSAQSEGFRVPSPASRNESPDHLEIGELNWGPFSLSLGHIIWMLRNPDKRPTVIRGSVQKYNSSIIIVIFMEETEAKASIWEGRCNVDEEIQGVIRTLSYKIFRELMQRGYN